MSDCEVMKQVREAIEELNRAKLLDVLHCSFQPCDISLEQDLFVLATKGLISHPECSRSATQIVYILSNYGADVNNMSQDGGVLVLNSFRDSPEALSAEFVQALLRCGFDITMKDQDGESLIGYVLHSGVIPRSIQELVLNFMPGMWKAVESDDAMSVRKLVNQWCNIRVTKNGKSVLQLAFEKGTEEIIRVITGIGASMDLAHGVLAGDTEYVRSLLNSKRKLNINIKNLSEKGATPIFYALIDNNCDMIDLLLENGARLDISMHGENETELPLYFAALSYQVVEESLLKKIIPTSPVPVDQLFYRGCNILFYCIEHNISADLFEEILRKCSAYVLTQKIERNVSARDYAVCLERKELVSRIDKVVSEWIFYSTNKKNRNILALHGYKHVPALQINNLDPSVPVHILGYIKVFSEYKHIFKDLNSNDNKLDDCFLDLADYENHKVLLTQAVEDGDLVSVREMLFYESVLEKGLETCMADCRCSVSGQPLLHKAVLRGYAEITQLLADTLVHVTKQKIDSVRDQYFRTCLHYAYGMENGKQIINILEEHGASEFSMDKDGRSPLAFKDRQGQAEMKKLLQYHLAQDFCKPEPDPWSVPLPMPIMGYISKCIHKHQHLKYEGSKAVSCDQYDKIDQKTSQLVISSDSDDFGHQYSQIKQNNNIGKAKSTKRVRISQAHYDSSLELTTSLDCEDCEELENENKYREPFRLEVGANHADTSKSVTKNGISLGLIPEADSSYKSRSDFMTPQRESLEHSDSWRTSSVDTESEGSEEYEADNSSSGEEEEERVVTFEQKYCLIL